MSSPTGDEECAVGDSTEAVALSQVYLAAPGGGLIAGSLRCSYYALRFIPKDRTAASNLGVPSAFLVIPLLSIRRAEAPKPARGRMPLLLLHCKDVRVVSLFFQQAEGANQVLRLVENLAFPAKLAHVFAFDAGRDGSSLGSHAGWYDAYNPAEEFARQGATDAINPLTGQLQWRATAVNEQYQFSPTYPHHIMVPATVTDANLAPLQRFRSKGRIPALTWRFRGNGTCMMRSAQARIGMSNSSCAEDLKMCLELKAVSDAYIKATAHVQHCIKMGAVDDSAQGGSPGSAASPPAPPRVSMHESLAAARRSSSKSGSSTAPGAGASSVPKATPVFDPHNPFNAPPAPAAAATGPWPLFGTSATGDSAGGPTAFGGSTAEAQVPSSASLHAAMLAETPSLLIADCRPSANAIAQKAGGWGYESYAQCETVFLGIHNIHAVRDAHRRMEALVRKNGPTSAGDAPSSDDLSWWGAVESAGWYTMVRTILTASWRVAHAMATQKRSVLVHCSDGWDRTAQVCGLVQVMLDPHARTVRGLCGLIAKEWCAFGHKFQSRTGHGDRRADDDKEVSPVFVQWLDCLWQLLVAFPWAFEYTPRLLRALAHHLTSCRFGTFLLDCESERRSARLPQLTQSLWGWVMSQTEKERTLLAASLPPPAAASVPPSGAASPADAAAAAEADVVHVAGFLNPQYDLISQDCILLPPCSVIVRGVRVWEDWWAQFAPAPMGVTAMGTTPGPSGDPRWGYWWAHPSAMAACTQQSQCGKGAPTAIRGGGSSPPSGEMASPLPAVPSPGLAMPLADSPYGANSITRQAADNEGRQSGLNAASPARQCPYALRVYRGDGLGHRAGREDTALVDINAARQQVGLPPLVPPHEANRRHTLGGAATAGDTSPRSPRQGSPLAQGQHPIAPLDKADAEEASDASPVAVEDAASGTATERAPSPPFTPLTADTPTSVPLARVDPLTGEVIASPTAAPAAPIEEDAFSPGPGGQSMGADSAGADSGHEGSDAGGSDEESSPSE